MSSASSGSAWRPRPALATRVRLRSRLVEPAFVEPAFVEHRGTGGGFRNVMRLHPGRGLGVVITADTTRSYDHDVLMRAVLDSVNP